MYRTERDFHVKKKKKKNQLICILNSEDFRDESEVPESPEEKKKIKFQSGGADFLLKNWR